MSVQDVVRKRRINEILHFTTNKGLTGIFASAHVKPRKQLTQDSYLEYIRKYNCPDRSRDTAWHDFVNLSISSVNIRLFDISRGKWHHPGENWWCILGFSPSLLDEIGVYFVTTNNIYSGAQRAPGVNGLENMFGQQIVRYPGTVITRLSSLPSSQPTCNQAEVLYPGELSLDYLNTVYVENEMNAAKVESMPGLFGHDVKFDCLVEPRLFGSQKGPNP